MNARTNTNVLGPRSGIVISDVSGLQAALNSKQAVGSYVTQNQTGNFITHIKSDDIVSALGYTPYPSGSKITSTLNPIKMSDVENLQLIIDSKQPSGNYAFSTDIKSLQENKANLRHLHRVEDVIGLEVNNVYNYNVYNYGVSHSGNSITNTLNFQKLIDKAGFDAVNSNNGVVINIPEQPSTGNDSYINLQFPVFINFPKTCIKGSSEYNSRLKSIGPSIVFGKHPKYWEVDKKHFDDKFSLIGSVASGLNVISNIAPAYMERIRIGCGVSGVGIPSDSIVTKVNKQNNTIVLNKTFNKSSDVELFFYSANINTFGNLSTSSNVISNVPVLDFNNITLGSLVSGINFQYPTYVVNKIDNNSQIVISRPPLNTGRLPMTCINFINNSYISINGTLTYDSSTISNISEKDIKRISINNKCSFGSILNATIIDVDRDNRSIKISTNSPISQENTEICISEGWFDLNWYQEDIADYTDGGLFKPNNGNPALQVSTSRNIFKALRTRGRIAQYRFPFHAMQLGGNTWLSTKQLTWEFAVYHHEQHLYGGIAGVGGQAYPDPWFLFGSPDPQDLNSSLYCFDLALTDDSGIDRTTVRLTIPQNSTVGIHRITFQFDPENNTEPVIAWVDGVRKQVKYYINWADHGGTYHKYDWHNYIQGDNFVFKQPFKNNRFNRLAKWEWRELIVGGVYESPGRGYSIYSGLHEENDFSILAVSCYSKLLYQTGTVGSSQKKINGENSDDSYVWAWNSGYNSLNAPIGSLTFVGGNSSSPDNDCELNAHVISYSKSSRLQSYGYICPRGISIHGMYSALSNCSISNIKLMQSENSGLSCGIYQGNFLYGNFENLEIDGYAAAIGSSSSSVCYTAHYKNLKLGAPLHLINQIAYVNSVNFNYVSSHGAMRTAGSRVHLHDFMAASPTVYTDGFWTDFSGTALGAGIKLSEGLVNWEDFFLFPSQYFIYTQKRPFHPENYLEITNVTNGVTAVPNVYLDDLSPNDRRRAKVTIDNCLNGMSQGVLVRGEDWTGFINVGPEAYSNSVVEYLPPILSGYGHNNSRIKTIDNFSYTLPYGGGGYCSNSHEINIVNPVEGGVSKWICNTPNPSKTFYEGSSNPPNWIPCEYINSFSKNLMSVNGCNSIYVKTGIDWPGQNFVDIRQGGFQIPFAKHVLSHVFLNEKPTNRSYINLGYIYNLVNMFGYNDNLSNLAFIKGNSSFEVNKYFAAAENGVKENIKSFTLKTVESNATRTTPSDQSWYILMTRPFVFTFQVSDSYNPVHATRTAYYGRTKPLPAKYWKFEGNKDVIIPSGGFQLRHVDRNAGWTIYGANKIMDYILDSSLSAKSSPSQIDLSKDLYIGLSKTKITASGTNITEPTDGNYSRVQVSRDSNNWQMLGDDYAVTNKNDIVFPTPFKHWDEITSIFFSDRPLGGNIIFKAVLNKSINVASGEDPPTFKAGSIHIQI